MLENLQLRASPRISASVTYTSPCFPPMKTSRFSLIDSIPDDIQLKGHYCYGHINHILQVDSYNGRFADYRRRIVLTRKRLEDQLMNAVCMSILRAVPGRKLLSLLVFLPRFTVSTPTSRAPSTLSFAMSVCRSKAHVWDVDKKKRYVGTEVSSIDRGTEHV